jgi:hypothetical protein
LTLSGEWCVKVLTKKAGRNNYPLGCTSVCGACGTEKFRNS